MSEISISVQNVSKAYRIWNSPASRLTSPLLEGAAASLPKMSTAHQWLRNRAAGNYRDFWALKEISFDVKRGESVGIIGRNGSGKSTLLQIIAGTLQPTRGSVQASGRVAALLELGSGFNPEFTGRENIFLTGAILGFSQEEIAQKFEEIAAFADIGEFIEQPIKTYSSGMTVRVAFAVQTAIHPDILIVDEALSVGDEAFQRKCFARIDLLKKRGTTLLFVSHGAAQVIELCDRAILLSDGEMAGNGRPKEIVNVYHQQIYGRTPVAPPPSVLPGNEKSSPAVASISGPRWQVTAQNAIDALDTSFLGAAQKNDSLHAYAEAGARISAPEIFSAAGTKVDHLTRGHFYHYAYEVVVTSDLKGVRFGATIKTLTGLEIAGMLTHPANDRLARASAGEHFGVRFKFRCRLLPGSYFFNAGVLALDGKGEEYFAHRLVDACMFRVIYEPNIPVNALVDLLEHAEIAQIDQAP